MFHRICQTQTRDLNQNVFECCLVVTIKVSSSPEISYFLRKVVILHYSLKFQLKISRTCTCPHGPFAAVNFRVLSPF